MSMRTVLTGKIHRARVIDADIDYEGSITLDPVLMEAADILPHEMVHVLDVDNGARLVTYAMEGKRGSGEIRINGAAARLIGRGDLVIILVYKTVDEEEARNVQPRLVLVDEHNRIRPRFIDSQTDSQAGSPPAKTPAHPRAN